MAKVFEYALVALVSIALFFAVAAWTFSAHRSRLQKDCQKMGQHRSQGLLIKCEVLEAEHV